MIIISVKHLKDLQKSFSRIKQRSLLPILNFVKIEAQGKMAKVTKNGLDTFVVYKIPADSKTKCSVLVQESVLWNVVSFSNPNDIVVISWDEKNYTVECGELKIKNITEDILHFPTTQEPGANTGTKINIGEIQQLQSIILDEEIKTEASYVFAGNGKAAGSDRFVGYCVDFTGDLKLSLRKEVLGILPPEEMEIRQSDNYDFFITENFTYGFVRSEIKFFDIQKFFVIPSELKGFDLNKKDLLKFVDLTISSSTAKEGATISFSIKGNKMHLSAEDDISGNIITSTIGISSPIDFPAVSFIAERLSKLLKSIPYEELTFIPGDNKHFVKAPDGSVGLIMQLTPQ